MRIRLEKPAEWFGRRKMQSFKEPGEYTVRREVGDNLITRGLAIEIEAPTSAEAKTVAKKNAG